MPVDEARVRALGRARHRVAVRLTTLVIVVYFGFIALIAFDKPLMGRELTPGLSIGILLGALVILGCWVSTWLYIRWANRVYDPELDAIRRES